MATITRTLGTAISPEYIKNWTMGMGIRELLQNFIDTKQAFECEGKVTYNGNCCIISDNGPGLELRHLALGISEKSEEAIGQFGEGLKLALLLFSREGRSIELRSKDYKLTPAIRDSEYGTPTLFFDIQEGLKEIIGTKITFQCSSSELMQAKAYFPLAFRTSNKITWVVKGLISSPGGGLYVNGSYVAEIQDSLFSYHLKGDKAKKLSNRDRTIVNISEAVSLIRDVLFYDDEFDPKVLIPWFKDVFSAFKHDEDDVFERKLSPSSYRNKMLEAIKAGFEAVYGKRTVLKNGSTDRAAAICSRMGMNPVYLPWEWNNAVNCAGIMSADKFAKESPIDKTMKYIKILSKEEQENLDFAVDMVTKFYNAPTTIHVVEDLDSLLGIYSYGGSPGTVAGLYHKGENLILVVRSALKSKLDAVRVILHETVHQKSKADDLTSEFQAAYDMIAAKLLMELSELV